MGTRRHTSTSVAEMVISHGAPPDLAKAIMATLTAAGLSASESRAWLSHPARAYPVNTGETMLIAGTPYLRRLTPIFAVEDGLGTVVLNAAKRFAQASAHERFTTLWLGGDVDDARRLTGGDAARASTVVRIVTVLKNRLRKHEHVQDVAQTLLPNHPGQRMVDLILAGREAEVLAALESSAIDVRALLDQGELELHGW